ncbi:protein GrpE [Caldovatus sediminis]|uniref:Protein GrpE n=1 Tax=Caldovatus sediminis TaxID=2041189 RepID=A0A8J2ZEL2_9PROT|nr:nucleotide exchange factor GrpE [Caldovatus sediminis]GGG45866.1 protein GrpE [Caldovatus sediminis]
MKNDHTETTPAAAPLSGQADARGLTAARDEVPAPGGGTARGPGDAATARTEEAGQPPGAASMADRIAALEAENAALKDRWLRAEAELQNLRARTRREVEDARNYAIQKFAREVVEAAENLRRGLESLPPPTEHEPELLRTLRGGFEEVERSFLAMLERNGVVRVEAQGRPFDPELHQAMAEQPAPEGVEPGTVLQAWTPAWTLHGRLLKPAMVVVAGSRGGDAGKPGGDSPRA